MKTLCSLLVTVFLSVNLCPADDSYSEVPLTAGDLKNILELDAYKFRVDFEKSGYPKLEINDYIGNPIIVTLSNPSKSATIVTYLERGKPYPTESGIRRLDTIHYWFSNKQEGRHSSFQFDAGKAKHTTTRLNKGIYTVIATKSKDDKDEIAYTLQITSANKPRTGGKTESPTRPRPKSK